MAHPGLDYDGVRAAYDAVAAEYAQYLPDVRAESPLELAMLDAFAAAVSVEPDAMVLDAGCGTGRISRYLADRGPAVRGLDLSPGMITMARRDHPDLPFQVGSLTALPFPDDTFAGIVLWYSIIHTPPGGQPLIYREVARTLRPGGHVLVASQSGEGTRDVSASYRPYGHEITMVRYCYTADQMSGYLAAAGLAELARLVRRPVNIENDDQAFVLARKVNTTEPLLPTDEEPMPPS